MSEALSGGNLNAATEALRNLYSTTPENGALSLASIAQAVLEAANVAALRTRVAELETKLGQFQHDDTRDWERVIVAMGDEGNEDGGVVDRVCRLIERQRTRITELEAELAKHQESQFHPDWSQLESTRESLREAWARLKEVEQTAAETSRKAFLTCERIAVDYEKMTGEEFEAVYGCDDVSVAIARRMKEAGE